jgi:hypothetical protein
MVYGSWFKVKHLGYMFWGSGLRVTALVLGLKVMGLGFGKGFKDYGSGCRVKS